MNDGQSGGDTDREEWVLILTCWPNYERGFERPALERVSDREKAENPRHKYASNDKLYPSDYTVRRRENVDSLPFEVSFDDCNTRYLHTDTDRDGGERP